MMLEKSTIALQLAYERRMGQLQGQEENVPDKENKARKWAENHWRDEHFQEEAERILDFLS